MRTIISVSILTVSIMAQDMDIGVNPSDPVEFEGYTVKKGFGAGAPDDRAGADDLPDRLCTAGELGCVLPPSPTDENQLPDKLCAPGDWNCTERDAGLPDRLCSDGTWGCFSDDSKKDNSSDGGTMINIFDDFFNSAVGLREITALGVSCATTAFMLSF